MPVIPENLPDVALDPITDNSTTNLFTDRNPEACLLYII